MLRALSSLSDRCPQNLIRCLERETESGVIPAALAIISSLGASLIFHSATGISINWKESFYVAGANGVIGYSISRLANLWFWQNDPNRQEISEV